jgi:HAD superfamily hydrolase (TIGR01509 family)
MNLRPRKIKAVFFDLDGTLVNSEPLKAEALSLTMQQFGAIVPKEIYKKVMGQSWEVVLNEFFQHGNKEIPENDFNPFFRTHYRQLIQSKIQTDLELCALMKALKVRGIKLAVVSSAAKWMVDEILKQISLDQVFDLIVTGDDVKKHKPDPEAYHFALQKLQASPNETLIFEDSEAGFQAAREVGVPVIAVLHDYNQNHSFQNTLAQIHSISEAKNVFQKLFDGGFKL